MSSNQALQRARHLFRAEKAGHTGSLDPLATGLLPLCFGEATKIAGHLLGNAQGLRDRGRGSALTTDTDDADGAPLRERPVPALDRAPHRGRAARLRRPHRAAPADLFRAQAGRRAAVREGAPRRGDRGARARSRGRRDRAARRSTAIGFSLRITCGSGTYVRSLVRDLGEPLGCGAHVAELRRLWVEPFRSQRMHTLDELQALRRERGRGGARGPAAAGRGRAGRLAEARASMPRRRRRSVRAGPVRPGSPAAAAAATSWRSIRRGRALGLVDALEMTACVAREAPVPLGTR